MTDKQKNYMRAKMAKVLFRYQDQVCHSCGSEQSCKDLGYGECGIFDSMAKDLINAGYGNVKQAVKEFGEKLKKQFLKHYPTMFTDAIYQCTDSELENFITELYGADE